MVKQRKSYDPNRDTKEGVIVRLNQCRVELNKCRDEMRALEEKLNFYESVPMGTFLLGQFGEWLSVECSDGIPTARGRNFDFTTKAGKKCEVKTSTIQQRGVWSFHRINETEKGINRCFDFLILIGAARIPADYVNLFGCCIFILSKNDVLSHNLNDNPRISPVEGRGKYRFIWEYQIKTKEQIKLALAE